jgi:hypothetical protein
VRRIKVPHFRHPVCEYHLKRWCPVFCMCRIPIMGNNNTEESRMKHLYRMKLNDNLKRITGDVNKRWDVIKYTVPTRAMEVLLLLNYSVALVRKRTIPTERPPLVGEVSVNLCG